MPLFFLGDGVFDCCMDQSSFQSDPAPGFFFFPSHYPWSIQWVHGTIVGAGDLSRVLVFP